MATFMGEVNLLLLHSGQAEIPDAATFDNDSALERVQKQAKYFYADVHHELWRNMRPRWTMREFTLNLTDSSNEYEVSATTSPEYIVKDSMILYNSSGLEVGDLPYVRLKDYRNTYPSAGDGSSLPEAWYLKVRSDNSSTDKIKFTPAPDATYTAKYLAYLKPVRLMDDADVVFLPDEYADIIRHKARVYFEIVLSEGKGPDWAQFIEELVTAVKAVSLGPVEDLPGWRTDFRIRGRNVGARYQAPHNHD